MQDLPHHYRVVASATPRGDVTLSAQDLEPIASDAPPEFDGPGGRWSPETLLMAAIGDCFVLSFRAVAGASKLAWESLECQVEGTLERSEGKMRFTEFQVTATLGVPADTNEQRAIRILQKAEANCLVTNSLSGQAHLTATVVVQPGG